MKRYVLAIVACLVAIIATPTQATVWEELRGKTCGAGIHSKETNFYGAVRMTFHEKDGVPMVTYASTINDYSAYIQINREGFNDAVRLNAPITVPFAVMDEGARKVGFDSAVKVEYRLQVGADGNIIAGTLDPRPAKRGNTLSQIENVVCKPTNLPPVAEKQ